MMQRRINIWANLDWVTIVIYLVLVFFGWINIYAAVYNEEHSSILDFSQRYGKQIIWISAAVIIAVSVLLIDSRFYLFFSYLFYLAVILGLLLVLVLGKEVNGARSWFELGSLSLQPSEFAKFATVLALARYLSGKNRELSQPVTLIASLAIIFTPALLIILQPDMGSALVYFALVLVLFRQGLSPYLFVSGIMAALLFILTLLLPNIYIYIGLVGLAIILHLFFGRSPVITFKGVVILSVITGLLYILFRWVNGNVNPGHILIIGVLLTALATIYYIYRYKAKTLLMIYVFLIGSILFVFSVNYVFTRILEPHHRTRINIMLGIESDPFGRGYNINQSKISIGSGGFSGKGFLEGTQTRFKFVPEQSTDFIFCTVGEEWGFLGTSFVVVMFSLLLVRIIALSERQRSSFSRIYGYGLFSVLLFHFIINIGMTIGLVPVIGIPLPFFSYGGSSLWGFTILLFIFLRLDASRNEYQL